MRDRRRMRPARETRPPPRQAGPPPEARRRSGSRGTTLHRDTREARCGRRATSAHLRPPPRRATARARCRDRARTRTSPRTSSSRERASSRGVARRPRATRLARQPAWRGRWTGCRHRPRGAPRTSRLPARSANSAALSPAKAGCVWQSTSPGMATRPLPSSSSTSPSSPAGRASCRPRRSFPPRTGRTRP